MELALQKYLRSGKKPEDLTTEYDIHVKRHGIYNNLILFKYGIDTPLGEQISQECRGIILDEDRNWEIVCYGYSKFFNHYEGLAAEIDWSSAKVLEKIDGSLCTIWYYDGKWNVSTSGTCDAGGDVGDFGFTFKDLFWTIWQDCGYYLPKLHLTDYCFMFEMVSKYNRIICRYDSAKIVLHGVRNRVTFQEYEPEEFAKDHGWQVVKAFPLQNLKEIIAFVQTLDPIEHEGFVVRDASFRRIKIKSPQYVALANIRGGLSTKRLIEIVRMGENSEFLGYFPEFTNLYNEVLTKYESLVTEITNSFANFSPIVTQKDYALAVKNLPYSGILFQMRKDPKIPVKDLLRDLRIEKVMDLLGLRLDKTYITIE